MFGFFRETPLPVEVYGKLPLARDYLRVGCAEGAGARWRAWMDESFSGRAGAELAPLGGPLAFCSGEAWGDPTFGVLWPSTDEGGLRKFPICFLVERKRKPARADFEAGWPAARALWAELSALKRLTESRADGQQFLAAVRGRELEIGSLAVRSFEHPEFDTWRDALGAGGRGLDEVLRALAEARRAGPRSLLRLPLVSNMDLVEQAWAWTTLCREYDLLEGEDGAPTVMFPADAPLEHPAFVLLCARALRAADGDWLATPSTTPLSSDDLCDGHVRLASVQRETHQPLASSLIGAFERTLGRR